MTATTYERRLAAVTAEGERGRLFTAHAQLTGMWSAAPAPGTHHHIVYSGALRRAADEVGLLPLCRAIVRNLRPAGAR